MTDTPQKETTVYEQDMWKITAEKTWLFSAWNLAKLAPILIFLGIALWNIYAYFALNKADEFIDIYNPNIGIISEDIVLVWDNFQNIAMQFQSVELHQDITNEEITQMGQEVDAVLAENQVYYERINTSAWIIENQACPLLKNSFQECIDFITLYQDMVTAFNDEDFETADTISYEMLEKSEIFIKAARKDNIEF